MKHSYNLVEESWIPCVSTDLKQSELSIREILLNAQDILEIRDSSPLITASIHRLLLTILHRNFGPKTKRDWINMWKQGKFDEKILLEYLQKWSHRFDMFDKERPFYQIPIVPKEFIDKRTPINKMSLEVSAGNNPTLFDHNTDDKPIQTNSAKAARLIVGFQSSAIGGGKSMMGYTGHGAIVSGAVFLLKGKNLFETLMLNLIQYDPQHDEPFPAKSDCPVWERDDIDYWGQDRQVDGYLDYLTWQSRTIHLFPIERNGQTEVDEIFLAQGVKIKNESLKDPQKAYRESKDHGFISIKTDPTRAMWRNSSSILMLDSKEFLPPLSFRWVGQFILKKIIPSSLRYNIQTLGISTDKAKINLWEHTTIPLPVTYLQDKDLVLYLADAISETEKVSNVLRKGTRNLARNLLAFKDGDKPDPKVVSNVASSFDVLGDYWASLEVPFYSLMVELPNIDDKKSRIYQWVRSDVKQAAQKSFDRCVNGLSSNNKSLKAIVQAENKFHFDLNLIMKELEEHNYGK